MCCLAPVASSSKGRLRLGKQACPLVASTMAGCTMTAAVITAHGEYWNWLYKMASSSMTQPRGIGPSNACMPSTSLQKPGSVLPL